MSSIRIHREINVYICLFFIFGQNLLKSKTPLTKFAKIKANFYFSKFLDKFQTLVFEQVRSDGDKSEFKWSLVGLCLTDRPVNFIAMKNL